MTDPAPLRAAVESFLDPETGRPLGELGQVESIEATSAGGRVRVSLTSWTAPIRDEFRAELAASLAKRCGGAPEGYSVELGVCERPAEKLGQVGVTAKSVIAVGSGKGGVGKSTMAVSIACALSKAGSKVGLMDADVYGPSVPHLLGVNERPTAVNQKLQPIERGGLKLMSMGFMVDPGEAVVWRGPMLHGAVTQMLRDTAWGDLDYLVIDMPPGTGDVALTLSQLLPLSGAVVVCTPQDVALLDAVKAIAMFRKVNIPLLGLVENMSYFQCPGCERKYDIFGTGGARAKARELGVPVLGEAPIHIDLRRRGDDGDSAANLDDAAIAPYLWEITRAMVRNLARSHAAAPPLPSLPVL